MEPLTQEQLDDYLCRVQLSDLAHSVTPDLRLLCQLHLAHVQQIPYENLSLHLDKARQQFPKILLDTDSLVNKIVHHSRGGYCFESNLLFAAVLKACGFSIYLVSVRTIRVMPVVPNQVAPHIAIGVVLDGVHWHCDVGYGGRGVRLPIRNDLVQAPGCGQPVTVVSSRERLYSESTLAKEVYKDVEKAWQAAHGKCPAYGHRLRTKIVPEDAIGTSSIPAQLPALYLQALDSKGEFTDQYYFYLQETSFAEFLMLSWYTSTCQLANHLNSVNVAMQTSEGRHTYDGKEFKVFKGTELVWCYAPVSDEDVNAHLKQLFNLTFD